MWKRGSRLFAVVTSLVVGSLVAGVANAQSEDQIKAAFLFNFARYVEWPSGVFTSDAAPIKMCMLEADAFSSVVAETVSGKNVGDRSVEVVVIQSLSSSNGCHLVYVGGVDATLPMRVVSELGDAKVFTVSDFEGFAAEGGMANFFRADNKIRFEMNPKAAKEVGLKISSRLLRLAKVVK